MFEMLNRLSHVVIGCAIEVRRALGPGLIESAYEESPVDTPKKTEKYGSGLSSEFGVQSSGHQPDAHTPIRRYADTSRPPRPIFSVSNLPGLAGMT